MKGFKFKSYIPIASSGVSGALGFKFGTPTAVLNSPLRLIKILSILDLKKDYDVFNICSSKPIKVIKIIDKLKISTKYQNIKNISMNKHEVYKTYGSNKKILKKIKIKNIFLPIHTGVQRTINWFNKYENLL